MPRSRLPNGAAGTEGAMAVPVPAPFLGVTASSRGIPGWVVIPKRRNLESPSCILPPRVLTDTALGA